jgi:hypothetical protein
MPFSPKHLEILTQTECEYFANLLQKNRSEAEAAGIQPDSVNLDVYREKILNTIHVLNENMVKPEVSTEALLEFHNQSTVTNIIKLLRRGKQMYEARTQVTRILR